ncbi:hypothetical protein C7B77_05635 [Chamaesiphon polymorphus CCALA 037]|uniref:Type 4 fimbrial biogenesis protein PilX N-terminal domain-containing protein n=2 Tax=Chamaesiphon TaxID=217161 RepID=A0A2T1GK54_9CYAN|nr:hypothetical protein C7B77_05635 [Chamaesiphon polymorphus CCALA 037]
MLRAQQIAQQEPRTDRGYAMMTISIVSVLIFSVLAAYMTIANLSKSSTNASVDANNGFYVAESGLNKRAEQLRQKFANTITPSAGSGTTPTSIVSCFSVLTTASLTSNDFECRNYLFEHSDRSSVKVKNLGNKDAIGGSTEVTDRNQTLDYTAFTYVKPERDYTTTPPASTVISPGEPFAGLNALEYRYTIYSTARKLTSHYLTDPGFTAAEIEAKNRSTRITGDAALVESYNAKRAAALDVAEAVSKSSTNIVLQMDFKSRVVPLFQFAAFYEDDLEMDSQMPMSVSGPIHTNSDLMAMSYSINQDPSVSGKVGYPSVTFSDANVRDGTRLLGKVTAAGNIYAGVAAQTWTPGTPACGTTNNCGVMSVYKGSGSLTSRDSYYYFPDKTFDKANTPKLTTAQIAVFGDRMKDKSGDVKRLSPPKPGFLREANYKTGETGLYYGKADMRIKFYPNRSMPFDFTSIQNGSGCSLTTYNIPSDRQGSGALTCSQLTKGQLRSLQQPVLFVPTTATLSTPDRDILKALRVAIASSPTVLTLNDLNNLAIPSTPGTWGKTFRDILAANSLPAPSATLKAKQLVETIASGSSFLPPPIQIVSGNTPSTDLNVNGSFYNQLKGAWMTMLQTNIGSLTYWNGFGTYVESTDPTTLTSGYAPAITPTISSGIPIDRLAFKTKAADTSKADLAGSFLHQGLASEDLTEGGLVLYASVSDDLNGDGTTSATEIVATSTSNNGSIPGKDADGNIITEVDYYRKYNGDGGVKRRSPYAFVFSGGSELPGPLTIATDQAAYLQGDYNNPNVTPGTIAAGTPYVPSNSLTGDSTVTPPIVGSVLGFYRQPAAIIADTITVLSNQCVNNNGRVGRVGTGTVNCGSSTAAIGSSSQSQVANGIAINAAFLSNLMKSGTRNADGSYTVIALNGGLNKYMRLLENWGGSTAGTQYNYSGSMVSLGEPLESSELPSGAGVPRRNFNFEPRFNALSGLPPLTPSAVYLRQDVFKRNY